jgi:hypothetical protein
MAPKVWILTLGSMTLRYGFRDKYHYREEP